jgi:CRISPR-associated endonuclease Cas1
VKDGIGNERREGYFSRVTRNLKRVVVLGHSGIISFEALRWIHDIGASFAQLDTDGHVIVAAGPSGLNDSRLRRAQALASTNGIAIEIDRELIGDKLRAQAKVLERLPPLERHSHELTEFIEELAESSSVEEIRRVEAEFALMYWSAWRDVPVRFETKDTRRVPEHWLTFGQRHSLLSNPSPRRAVNPANALLNYLYAILEAEAQIAALRMGLDPGLGLLHADQRTRDSLPCDLMEPVRPTVDAYVINLLQGRTFNRRDFFETRKGICRIMPPLTHELAGTAPIWAKELAPVTERVAQELFVNARDSRKNTSAARSGSVRSNPLPTPLTESNRSAGRGHYRRKPEPRTVEEMRAWLFG